MSKLFKYMDIENVLRADADGRPVFRPCHEFEVLLSFHDDLGAEAWDAWWHTEGLQAFSAWLLQSEEYSCLMEDY